VGLKEALPEEMSTLLGRMAVSGAREASGASDLKRGVQALERRHELRLKFID